MTTCGVDIVRQKEAVAVTYGQAYDFEKVFGAYAALIASLSVAFGGVSWIKPTKWLRNTTAMLPAEKQFLRAAWERMHSRYEITDETVDHLVGPLTLKASVLGNASLEYDLPSGTLRRKANAVLVGRIPDWIGDVAVLAVESVPEIFICKEELADGTLCGASVRDLDVVYNALKGPLAEYGMTYELAVDGDEGVAVVGFPFSRYRTVAGFGEVRVRCTVQGRVDPEGASA